MTASNLLERVLTQPVYKRHKTLWYNSESRLWRRIESSGEESAGESMVDEEDELGIASLISLASNVHYRTDSKVGRRLQNRITLLRLLSPRAKFG